MLSTFVATCALGLALLSPCPGQTGEVAAVYQFYALSIPTAHLALVHCLYWASRGEANSVTGCIGLPSRANLHVIAHEVGHQVSFQGDLLERYGARFWPGSVQVDGVPTSYARTNIWEDFAESYSHMVTGDTHDMPARRDWLLAWLPELRH